MSLEVFEPDTGEYLDNEYLAPCYDKLPHVLAPNMTNVWVFEVGSEKYPGDEMIQHIATRKLRRLCSPLCFSTSLGACPQASLPQCS